MGSYRLTETASTRAVVGPDDHRAVISSDDPLIARRLLSAGRVLPSIEIEVRDDDNAPPATEAGLIFLRGDQIAGEYATGSVLDAADWFCTRDRGYVDPDSYLFIEGCVDDTIIPGGENIAPAEIEEVLLSDPAVAEVSVVGVAPRRHRQAAPTSRAPRPRWSQTDPSSPQPLTRRTPMALTVKPAPACSVPRARASSSSSRRGPGRLSSRSVCHDAITTATGRDASLVVVDGHDAGTAMGKRYVDAGETIELLRTKAGVGAAALNGELLVTKQAKALPASD